MVAIVLGMVAIELVAKVRGRDLTVILQLILSQITEKCLKDAKP